METSEIIKRLWELHDIGIIHYKDNDILALAAERLAELDRNASSEDAHVMTYHEILYSDGQVVWEEFYNGEEQEATQIYPVVVTEDAQVIGSDGSLEITEEMFVPDEDGNQFRWWDRKPTEEKRKTTPW